MPFTSRPSAPHLRLVTDQETASPSGQDSRSAARAVQPWQLMLEELEDGDQATVEKVIAGLEPDGVTGSAAWVELREAVAAAGRTEEWNEIVAGVRQGFEARGLHGAEAITPAFLGSAFCQLQGVGEFTAEHYDALTTSWRT